MLLDCFEILQLEEGSVVLFCINERQSPITNRLFIIQQMVTQKKSHTREARYAGYLIPFNRTEL